MDDEISRRYIDRMKIKPVRLPHSDYLLIHDNEAIVVKIVNLLVEDAESLGLEDRTKVIVTRRIALPLTKEDVRLIEEEGKTISPEDSYFYKSMSVGDLKKIRNRVNYLVNKWGSKEVY